MVKDSLLAMPLLLYRHMMQRSFIFENFERLECEIEVQVVYVDSDRDRVGEEIENYIKITRDCYGKLQL